MALLLSERARSQPDAPALIDGSRTTTWSMLDDRVNRLVNALRARGLVEGDVVASMTGNQVEAFEVALACMHGGFVLVPVNWHWVAAELGYVLDDADVAALVVGAAWTDVATAAIRATPSSASRLRARWAVADDAPEGFEGYEAVVAAADPAEPTDQARGGPMFYTSGTTGKPKGVRSTLAGTGGPPEIWAFIAGAIGDLIGFDADHPVHLLCGPIYHSAQWVFSVVPLLLGATVVLQHRFDAAEVLDLIDGHEVNALHLVPAQMVRLLRLRDDAARSYSGRSLRRVHHGAAPCPPEVKRALIDWWGPIVTEYYGGTEGGFITMIDADEWLERPTSVGRPVATAEVLVVGDDGTEMPAGQTGDLYFRSLVGSEFHYHKAREKTEAAHLRPGVATLGDVGHLDDDGYLHLTDRKIDMIISGGVNIYPAEIEGVLAAHEAVADVAVFGIPDDEMGEQVVAAVQLEPGLAAGAQSIAELEAHVREHLAGYKCPRRWDLVDEVPRTETGKLLKRALRDPHWGSVERSI